jgi:hypothetical protein
MVWPRARTTSAVKIDHMQGGGKRREVADIEHRPQLSPVLFRFSLHRRRLRVLDLDPMRGAAGAVGRA